MVARTSITRIAALTLALAAATIIGAWGFELIGGYKPCPLCLQQRHREVPAERVDEPVLGVPEARLTP